LKIGARAGFAGSAESEEIPLPARYLDHPLKGEWKGWRDLHLEPDWLLIYKIDGGTVRFERTGRLADLFDE
jgi:mRNA interferase YafQ